MRGLLYESTGVGAARRNIVASSLGEGGSGVCRRSQRSLPGYGGKPKGGRDHGFGPLGPMPDRLFVKGGLSLGFVLGDGDRSVPPQKKADVVEHLTGIRPRRL